MQPRRNNQHPGIVSSPLSLDFPICKMGKLLAFLWGWQLLGTGAGGREDLLTAGHHGKRPTAGPAGPQSQPPQEERKGSGGLGHHSRGAPEINKTVARHLKPRRASKKLRARVPLPGGHALPTDWGHGQNKLSRFPAGRGGHTVAREKGEKTGHLALSLCFLLGSGGVCAGEDSCLPRSPQKARLCQRPGACSAAVTLGALHCSGSGSAWLAPASGHRQARGLDHQVLA